LISWITVNEYALQATGYENVSEKGSYSKNLPNVDFDINFTDDIKARASYSKTIARPDYNDIKGGLVWGAAPRIAQGDVSKGNPDLDPIESTNFDVSAEWYYSDASYVSLGYFKKDVVDFIGSASTVITDSGYHTPINGPRYQAAIASEGADATLEEIRDYIIANYPTTVTGQSIHALAEDPILPFTLTQPINNKDTSLDGIELSLQHTFGESGFGFQANATKVDSDTEFDDLSKATQFAIFGLSDSANFIGFYDKDSLQVRIAYNWRDSFLASLGDNLGGNNPLYTEEYGQVDASVSYDFTDNLTLSFEALNLTDEHMRQYARQEHLVRTYTETGARYNLGVRYSF
jgi:TonB-dependent receptor